MRTPADTLKEMELTDNLLDIINAQMQSLEHNDGLEYTQSDLQGAIQAIIMKAIDYGKGTK